MAANNYFGFTHGAAQYSAQATTAYPAAAQTAYVQPAAPAAYATPRPAYDTYQTSHAAAASPYAYATRTQVVATPAYDATKTYYAAPAAAPAAAAAVYTVAETPYQAYITGGSIPVTLSSSTAKPAYVSATYSTTPAPARQAAVVKTQPVSQASAGTYIYANTAASAASAATYGATSNSSSYSAGYDAALYSAATNYYQQQQTPRSGAGSTINSVPTTWQAKKVFAAKMRPKVPPKQPQLHYCEVCKISCAGPQTYREHLEGQKHKKKELALKVGGSAASGGSQSMSGSRSLQNQLRCELCDVACTGSDAYSAHIRGAKHQKVFKLHQKLGKPIPSTEPQLATATTTTATTAGAGKAVSSAATKVTSATSTKLTTATAAAAAGQRKVVATPKITFVGGGALKTTGIKAEDAKTETKAEPQAANKSENEDKGADMEMLLPGEKDVQPVGHEYIDEVRNELGVCVSFHCKLCDCKFNDPNAKIMHMKGRRHRLQYKKKVDPNLQVEIKPSIRMRKVQEDRMRRQHKEEFWRRREHEERWHEEMRMMYESDMYYGGGGPWPGRGMQEPNFGPPHGNPGGPATNMRRPDSMDDRYVMAKHTSIYPKEIELAAVQKIVSACEKSLKLVSDFIAESDAPKVEVKAKDEPKEAGKATEKRSDSTDEKKSGVSSSARALKGVMRVGVLAKGLLLHDDLNVRLVVLCAEKPTRTLLVRVADNLPKQLKMVPEDKCEVKICVEEAAVVVTMGREPATSCTITFTSPVMREENMIAGDSAAASREQKADPPDVLDQQKCLEALAALRHAKWFQARANGLPSCVIVIRVLRDLCKRVPTWAHISQWAMELLAEKCVSSGGNNMSPGDALRRIFECIASGILLPGGPGLQDPCERDPMDAAGSLTNQQREDITASAQHALRLIAFRQIYKVLDMEPLATSVAPGLPPASGAAGAASRFPRKRRLVSSNGDGDTVEDGSEGKKDKRDGKTDGATAAAQSS